MDHVIRNKTVKQVILIFNVFLAWSLIAWPLGLFVSMFFFDSPEAESNWIILSLAYSIWAYPIPVLFGAFLYWRGRATSTLRRSIFHTFISFCGPGLILLFSTLLVAVCDGQFACL